jgi:hypothetical protein
MPQQTMGRNLSRKLVQYCMLLLAGHGKNFDSKRLSAGQKPAFVYGAHSSAPNNRTQLEQFQETPTSANGGRGHARNGTGCKAWSAATLLRVEFRME